MKTGIKMTPLEFAAIVLGLDLYDWQAESVLAAVNGRRRVALVAANGSGKTACVNVVLLLWFLYTHPGGVAAVTSGSWTQLETQLWPNLMMHRHRFPNWKWGAHQISTPQGGFIRAYSTNQPGRAEGHHEHLPERPVMLMVDEAKSVPEPIFEALSRCTPTFFVLTSSPGAPAGTFHAAFRQARKLYHPVKVTAFDCPHIKPEKIKLAQMLYGPNYNEHPIYRSMILAEFTEGEDAMIIPRKYIERALMHKPAERTGGRYAAVDWAAGGDETVLAERCGNAVRILWHDRVKDTMQSAARTIAECKARGLEEKHVWGDVCGIGLPIHQAAQKLYGWRFRPFNGGQAPLDEEHYLNLNVQAWLYFRQSLERGDVCFPEGLDEMTISQLSNRYLEWNDKGKLKCESKEDMKERGLGSPDRADAIVMAWWAGRFCAYDDTPKKGKVQAKYTSRFAV